MLQTPKTLLSKFLSLPKKLNGPIYFFLGGGAEAPYVLTTWQWAWTLIVLERVGQLNSLDRRLVETTGVFEQLFQRISVVVQRFKSVLLHDDFVVFLLMGTVTSSLWCTALVITSLTNNLQVMYLSFNCNFAAIMQGSNK